MYDPELLVLAVVKLIFQSNPMIYTQKENNKHCLHVLDAASKKKEKSKTSYHQSV